MRLELNKDKEWAKRNIECVIKNLKIARRIPKIGMGTAQSPILLLEGENMSLTSASGQHLLVWDADF